MIIKEFVGFLGNKKAEKDKDAKAAKRAEKQSAKKPEPKK